jgi:hypothetical protein
MKTAGNSPNHNYLSNDPKYKPLLHSDLLNSSKKSAQQKRKNESFRDSSSKKIVRPIRMAKDLF